MEEIKLKQNGFTLVEILIGMSIIVGMSYGLMQLQKSSVKSQNESMISGDYVDLKREVNLILSNSTSCKASFATATSPLKFKGSTVKDKPVTGLELWSSDANGNRSAKKFFTGQIINKITVQEISMTMPDYNLGTDFPANSTQSFLAEIKIVSNKKNFSNIKKLNDIKQNVYLTFTTNSGGLSTVTDCAAAAASATSAITKTRAGFCTSPVGPNNNGGEFCQPLPGYNLRYITACKPGSWRSYTCCYVPINEDSNGWCSVGMEGWSGCFNGCGADDTNYFVQEVNGVSGGSNDTHVCCFLPKKSNYTNPVSSGTVNQWSAFIGCTPLAGYNVIRTNAVTGGVGNQSTCTYVPIQP